MSGQMQQWERKTVWALVVLYIIVFSVFTVERHNRFNSSALDLGIQDQVLWNTLHGRLFQETIETESYLGDHVTLTIPLFSLLYLIREDVRIILIAQTILLALGAFPLAWLAAKKLRWQGAGLAAALAWLLYPPLGFINRFDFHPEAAVIALFLFAIWCFEEKKNVWGYVLTLLALFSKESYGLVIGVWGISLLLFDRKNWRRGLLFFLIGFAWSYFALFHIIPHFRGNPSDTLSRYAELGDTPEKMAKSLFSKPIQVFHIMFGQPAKRLYLWQMFWPLAGLCFLRPRLLIVTLPVLVYNLLSSNLNQFSLYYQYNGPLLPWLFWSAIAAASAIQEGNGWLFRKIPTGFRSKLAQSWFILLPVLGIVAFSLHNPLTQPIRSPNFEVYTWEKTANSKQILEAAEKIPEAASLATTMGLLPHFSHRQNIHLYWGWTWFDTDYVLFNLEDKRWGESKSRMIQWVQKALDYHDYEMIYFSSGVILLQNPQSKHVDTKKARQDLDFALKQCNPQYPIALEFDPVTGQPLILWPAGEVRNASTGETQTPFSCPKPFADFATLPDGNLLALNSWGEVKKAGMDAHSEHQPGIYTTYVDIELTPDGQGFYLLDCFGRIFTAGTAKSLGDDRDCLDSGPAVDLAVDPGGEGYAILRAYGRIASFGSVSLDGIFGPFKWNIARALELTGPDRGYLLDGFGGIHALGSAPRQIYPGYCGEDRVVDFALAPNGRLWVLDQDGRIQPAQSTEH